MKRSRKDNLIISLKSGENELIKNLNDKKCSGVPQVALLVESDTGKLVGESYVNTKSGNKTCQEDWQVGDKSLTHAERKLFHNHRNEIKEYENSLDLITSSHPCENCLIALNEFIPNIKNVHFISKSSYGHKINEYNEIFERKTDDEIFSICHYDEIDINIEHFNTYGDHEIESAISYYNIRLNDYLSHEMSKFIDMMEKGRVGLVKNGKIILNSDEFKDYRYQLEIICDALDKRIYTSNKRITKVDMDYIIGNKVNILKYMREEK